MQKTTRSKLEPPICWSHWSHLLTHRGFHSTVLSMQQWLGPGIVYFLLRMFYWIDLIMGSVRLEFSRYSRDYYIETGNNSWDHPLYDSGENWYFDTLDYISERRVDNDIRWRKLRISISALSCQGGNISQSIQQYLNSESYVTHRIWLAASDRNDFTWLIVLHSWKVLKHDTEWFCFEYTYTINYVFHHRLHTQFLIYISLAVSNSVGASIPEMHFITPHVLLFFLANSNVIAKPNSQINDLNIKTPIIHRDVDPTGSQLANSQSDEPKPGLCRPKPPPEPNLQGPISPTEPSKPQRKAKKPKPIHPKDECPYPGYTILVTCPLDVRTRRGRMKGQIIGGSRQLLYQTLMHCAYGEYSFSLVKCVTWSFIGQYRNQG